MRYFSTFSGIGGFEIGIQNAIESNRTAQQANANTGHSADNKGDSLQKWGQSATCIGYSEIDKYAIKVYERQFNGHKNYGDITQINADELPDFDCLVGGFPCQAFSIAGKRKGFDDTRGTLFFDLARILRAKRPRLFVFENVKGLLSHDNGNTFSTIISTLTELGYDCQWQVLNSKNHGVPQNRERIIIVGHLRGTSRPEVFPLGQCSQWSIESDAKQKPQADIARTVDTRTGSYPKFGQYIAPVLTPDRPEKRQNGRRFKEDGEPSFTLTGQDRHGIYDGMKIRRLTPIECERLQGFPDNWTKFGVGDEPISDSQRYKMCGNAVTTNVIQAVFEQIFKQSNLEGKEQL